MFSEHLKEKSLQKCVHPTTTTLSFGSTDNHEKLAKEMHLEQESSTIRQIAGGFSPVNVQRASFATGASAIFVVAITTLGILICCWKHTKGQRWSKSRHRQLLSTITYPIIPGPSSGGERPAEHRSTGVHPSEATKWVRTPSGWASIPGVYLPTPGPAAQLPFTHFPPMCYNGSLERGSSLSPLSLGSTSGAGRPSDVSTARLSSSQHPASLSCMTRSLLPGGRVPGGHPQLLRLQPQRPGPPLGQHFLMSHRNPSPSRNNTLLCPGDPHCTLWNQSCSPSGRLIPRKEQLVCSPQRIERLRPALSVSGYNSVVGSSPGFVQSMKVTF